MTKSIIMAALAAFAAPVCAAAGPAAGVPAALSITRSGIAKTEVSMPGAPRAAANPEAGLAFARNVITLKAAHAPASGKATVVARIKYPPLRDVHLTPSIGFTAAKKTEVYVSGAGASNCVSSAHNCDGVNKYYVIFNTSGRIFGANAYHLATSGSKDILFPGETEPCTVSIQPDIFTPANSIVDVTQNGSSLFRATAKQVGEAVSAKGTQLTLSQKYVLFYGTDLLEDQYLDVHFAGKDKTSFIFVPAADAMKNYFMPESAVTREGVTFQGFESGYIFRKTADGYLEILSR
ncbi:MAG: hypothetical protein WC421_09535 [Elusimicrobiales bacterium]